MAGKEPSLIVEEALRSFHQCLGGEAIEWRKIPTSDKHRDITSAYCDNGIGDTFLVRTEIMHLADLMPRDVVDFLLPERKSWSSQLVSERILDCVGENCVTNQVVFQGIGRSILVTLHLAEACFSDGDRGFYVVHASAPADRAQLAKLPMHIVHKEVSWSGYWIRPATRRTASGVSETTGARLTWICCASHEQWMACPRALCRFSRRAFRAFTAFQLRQFACDLASHAAATRRASGRPAEPPPAEEGKEEAGEVEEGLDPSAIYSLLMSVQAEALLRIAEKDSEIELLRRQLGHPVPASPGNGMGLASPPAGPSDGKRRREGEAGRAVPPLGGAVAAPVGPGGAPMGVPFVQVPGVQMQGVPVVYGYGVPPLATSSGVPLARGMPPMAPKPPNASSLDVRHGYTMSAPMPAGSRRGRVKGTSHAKKAALAVAGAPGSPSVPATPPTPAPAPAPVFAAAVPAPLFASVPAPGFPPAPPTVSGFPTAPAPAPLFASVPAPVTAPVPAPAPAPAPVPDPTPALVSIPAPVCSPGAAPEPPAGGHESPAEAEQEGEDGGADGAAPDEPPREATYD